MEKLTITLTAAMRKQAYEAMVTDMIMCKYRLLCSCMVGWLKDNYVPAYKLYIEDGRDSLLLVMSNLLPELYAQRPHNEVMWWSYNDTDSRIQALRGALAMLQEKHPELFTDSSTSP